MNENVIQGPMGTAEWIEAPDGSPTMASWLLYLPFAHPIWQHYLMGLITLEDMPGFPPAHKHFPDATHEIMVCALDPQKRPNAHNLASRVPLQPLNIVEQFNTSDEKALNIFKECVARVTAGVLIPEPQGIMGAKEQWRQTIEVLLRKTICPVCKGTGIVTLSWGKVTKCGFCLGKGEYTPKS